MNAFEIRLELLKLAREILNEDYYSQRSKTDQEWAMKSEEYTTGKTKEKPEYVLPNPVTTEDILQTADKLNTFISKG